MLEKLGIDWRLLSFQIFNFLVLLFILRKVLYKPIINFLESRRRKIEDGLAKAEKFEEEWQKIKNAEADKMAEVEKKAVRIMEQARLDAEKKEKELLAAARQSSEKIIEDAKKDISKEKEKILAELKKETADYIIFATEKILKRVVNERDEKEIIKETIDILSRK